MTQSNKDTMTPKKTKQDQYLKIGADGTTEIVGVKNPNIVKFKTNKNGNYIFKYKT